MTVPIRLRLNGQHREIEVAPTETMQSVLRWRCGLSSVRSTCGIGVCGACTVLLDGAAVSSCLLLAPLADGRAVDTVEGLARDDPVVEAFVAQNAFQCSYCTPGLVIATRGLLALHPDPTDEQVRAHLAGNLCRCGSYYAILAAVRDAADRLSRSPQRRNSSLGRVFFLRP
jgi:aerobic-type carbon monoxide dehydrogenase small subunit (CoxS/CutS family)